NLSKGLIHVGNGSRHFVTGDGINRKELATMSPSELAPSASFSRLRPGRKRRAVPKELDFTGHNPIMVVEHLKKRRTAEEGAEYEEKQLSVMLEKSANIVDECKTVNYGIGREKLAQMTTEELRDYAKFFATALAKINLNQSNNCNS
ncbi:8272_t:CDS:2, partial [Paraglomus brasilianum]